MKSVLENEPFEGKDENNFELVGGLRNVETKGGSDQESAGNRKVGSRLFAASIAYCFSQPYCYPCMYRTSDPGVLVSILSGASLERNNLLGILPTNKDKSTLTRQLR